VVQFITACFFVGNWVSFGLINIPRVVMSTFTNKGIYKRKIKTREGTVKYHRAERIFRIASLSLALCLEIACASFLAD
jgi:hypothetical protein